MTGGVMLWMFLGVVMLTGLTLVWWFRPRKPTVGEELEHFDFDVAKKNQ
jgi:hypothetical protein